MVGREDGESVVWVVDMKNVSACRPLGRPDEKVRQMAMGVTGQVRFLFPPPTSARCGPAFADRPWDAGAFRHNTPTIRRTETLLPATARGAIIAAARSILRSNWGSVYHVIWRRLI